MALKALVETMARHLVDHPQDVVVTEINGNHITILELEVAKEDVGQVVGRQGRTAQALRTILGACSAKLKRRSVLEIVEDRYKEVPARKTTEYPDFYRNRSIAS